MVKRVCGVFLCVFLFFSCVSTDFKFSVVASESDFSMLDELQLDILELRFENDGVKFSEKQTQIWKKIRGLKERDLTDNAYYSRVFALEGEFAQIVGERTLLQNAISALKKTDGKNEFLVILKSFLEKSPKKRVQMLKANGSSPLNRLYLAVAQYDAEDYVDAVSNFDRAFVALPEKYSFYYMEMRQTAFQFMQNSRENNPVFHQKQLSYKQVLTGIINVSPVFQKLLQVQKVSAESVFNFLQSKKIVAKRVKIQDVCLRADLARILISIFATESEKTTFLRRSETYKNREYSPIYDVGFDHSDFVSIIFAVERKFIELRDGENFFPQEAIGGFEFNNTLKQIGKIKISG